MSFHSKSWILVKQCWLPFENFARSFRWFSEVPSHPKKLPLVALFPWWSPLGASGFSSTDSSRNSDPAMSWNPDFGVFLGGTNGFNLRYMLNMAWTIVPMHCTRLSSVSMLHLHVGYFFKNRQIAYHVS